MKTKRFPCRDLLTVTTYRLLTKSRGPHDNGIGDLYEILEWMTDDTPFTHSLPRFGEECKSWILRWFPELGKVDSYLDKLDEMLSEAAKLDKAAVCERWLEIVKTKCGLKDEYDVPKIPRDDHDFIDPAEELMGMNGDGTRVISVDVDDLE